MREYLIGCMIGLVVGILIIGILMSNSIPDNILLETECKYNFNETADVLEMSINKQGWIISKAVDLKSEMSHLNKSVRSTKIYDIIHPNYTATLLNGDSKRFTANLMPCRIAIYEIEDGSVHVSRANLNMMANELTGENKEAIKKAAQEVEAIIRNIIIIEGE